MLRFNFSNCYRFSQYNRFLPTSIITTTTTTTSTYINSFRAASSSSSGSTNNNSNEEMTSTSTTSNKNFSKEDQPRFFISQKGNFFFTSSSFSVIKDVKNTLVPNTDISVLTSQFEQQQQVGKNGKKMKLTKKQIQELRQQLLTLSPKIATDGRILKRFRHPKKSLYRRFTDSFKSAEEIKLRDQKQRLDAISKGIPQLPSHFARRKWWYVMMPTGYPHSVASGFGRFFVLNIIGCALSAFSLTLATQALLSSFFAHGTSAGWLLKDILPAFLTAYLAHKFINVELHPREWFIVANVLTQGAVCFDFAIPHLAEFFKTSDILVPLAASTSFVKGLAMLILTTSRTALVQAFSREGNLVELSKRLHGMLVFTYPVVAGVALGVHMTLELSTVTTASLVLCMSLACLAVAVSIVRPIFPKLINAECAVESCRRHINSNPVIRAAEAPTVALFSRRVYSVPFKVGLSLNQESMKAKARGESLMLISLHDVFHKAKFLFVFKKPIIEEKQEQQKNIGEEELLNNEQEQQQQEQEQKDLTQPENFIGVVFDVHATFSDVIEGLYAALLFYENSCFSTNSSSSSSSGNDDQEHQHSLSEIKNDNNNQKHFRTFLKRPKASDITSIVQQFSAGGWQIRAHHIDNRDYRVQISAQTSAQAAAVVAAAAAMNVGPYSTDVVAVSGVRDDSSPSSSYVRRNNRTTKKNKSAAVGSSSKTKSTKKKRTTTKKKKFSNSTTSSNSELKLKKEIALLQLRAAKKAAVAAIRARDRMERKRNDKKLLLLSAGKNSNNHNNENEPSSSVKIKTVSTRRKSKIHNSNNSPRPPRGLKALIRKAMDRNRVILRNKK